MFDFCVFSNSRSKSRHLVHPAQLPPEHPQHRPALWLFRSERIAKNTPAATSIRTAIVEIIGPMVCLLSYAAMLETDRSAAFAAFLYLFGRKMRNSIAASAAKQGAQSRLNIINEYAVTPVNATASWV